MRKFIKGLFITALSGLIIAMVSIPILLVFGGFRDLLNQASSTVIVARNFMLSTINSIPISKY